MTKRVKNRILISAVCPFHNNAKQINALAGEIRVALGGYRVELICVDDGSADNTWAEIRKLTNSGNAEFRVRGIRLSRNFGQHAAIVAGLDKARGDYVVVLDGDQQDNPAYIPAMIKKAMSGFDVVHARRRPAPFSWRGILRSCVHYLLTWSSEITLHEAMGNYKLLSRRALRAALRFAGNEPLLELMVHKIGFPAANVIVERRERPLGRSSYGLGKSLGFLSGLLVAYSSLAFSAFILLGILSCAGAVISYVGFSASYLALALLQMGVTFLVGGTVGLYVRRLQIAGRNWPQYLVQEEL